jgi:cyclopropane fatty-acyl-phospholipid synthase-like methyltransferase
VNLLDNSGREYIPALGLRSLNRLYDPLLRLTMPERAFRRRLLEQARLMPGMRILDIGCGTGTLLVRAAEVQHASMLCGVDVDPSILQLALRKSAANQINVHLVGAHGGLLPFRSESFDRVFSTLMLHHLTHDEKGAALSEARRVLRPRGELHIADWGPPHSVAMRIASLSLRSFEHPDRTADNLSGLVPQLCRKAGFADVRTTTRFQTMFGTLELIAASIG